jgi:hypothetical protein
MGDYRDHRRQLRAIDIIFINPDGTQATFPELEKFREWKESKAQPRR